jgi:hypothetical protein
MAGDFVQTTLWKAFSGGPWVPNRPPASLYSHRTDAFNDMIDFAQTTYAYYGGDLEKLSFGVDVEPEAVFAPNNDGARIDPMGHNNSAAVGYWGDNGVSGGEQYNGIVAPSYHDMAEYVVTRLVKSDKCKLRSPSMAASYPRNSHPIVDEIPSMVGTYTYPSYFDEWGITIYEVTMQGVGPRAGPYEIIEAARNRLIMIRDLYRKTTAYDIYKKNLVIDECFGSPGLFGMTYSDKPLRTYEYGRDYLAGILDMIDRVGGFSKVYWFTVCDGVPPVTDPIDRYGFFKLDTLDVYPSLAGLAVASGSPDRYAGMASLNQNSGHIADPSWAGFGVGEYTNVNDLH